jgi:(p)ppGpp synthase/HD superfamily hydrolase
MVLKSTEEGHDMSMKIQTAINLAMHAHDGQVDKSGAPYIFHVMRVAHAFENDEDGQIVALLHDVVEDSDLTLEDLRDNGLPDRLSDAVRALTRNDNEAYAVYIKRAGRHPVARAVKIEDLHDHLRPMTDHLISASLRERYVRALKYLQGVDLRGVSYVEISSVLQ